MSLISNLTESNLLGDGSNGDGNSMKPNLGERRSTVNTVSPKIANELITCLNKIEDFDFNVFELNDIVGTNSMLYVCNEIFSSLYFYEDVIEEKRFRKFVSKITEGYDRKNVVYHNDLHATDVTQTLFVMMEKGSIYYKCNLLEIDYIAVLVAALCHDYKHPGIGNPYIINSKHKIAMSFNGKSLI